MGHRSHSERRKRVKPSIPSSSLPSKTGEEHSHKPVVSISALVFDQPPILENVPQEIASVISQYCPSNSMHTEQALTETDKNIMSLFEGCDLSGGHIQDVITPPTPVGSLAAALLREQPPASKAESKRLRANRLPFLKMLSRNPAFVTMDDTQATYARLNVLLKCSNNIVNVPEHWKFRSGVFLSSKVPKYAIVHSSQREYVLPRVIAELQVARQSVDQYRLAQRQTAKQAARTNLKVSTSSLSNNLDIDTLYVVFLSDKSLFRGPVLGGTQLYDERGSSMVGTFIRKELSPELMNALGMADNQPPPWLHRQQGLPLPQWLEQESIPGLTAPLPQGCHYGFDALGWGEKPTNSVYSNPRRAQCVSASGDRAFYWSY